MKVNILFIDDSSTGRIYNVLDNKDEWIEQSEANEESDFLFLDPFDYEHKLRNFYAEIRNFKANIILLDNKIEKGSTTIKGMDSGDKLKEIIKRLSPKSKVYVITREKIASDGKHIILKESIASELPKFINEYIQKEKGIMEVVNNIVNNDPVELENLRRIIEEGEEINLSADKADEIIKRLNNLLNI